MKHNQTIRQNGPGHLPGISRRSAFARLIALVTATAFLGSFASRQSALGQALETRLRPGDIVYVDLGGFVIKVDPTTEQQTIIAYGGYLQMPLGVLIDADGQIIVSDSGRLIRID